jgi:general secretion pathway protein D
MNLSVAFDPAFRETPAEVRLEAGMPLEAALDAVASASATFYRVTGPNAILVINDTPAKQREYLQEAARMIPLQNLDLKETIDALRITHDARKIAPFTPLNAFAVADTPERLEALTRFVSAIDKARAELVVDVEILEVNRALLREYGVQIASPGSPGIDGSVGIDREVLSLEDLRNLSRANVLSAGIPALYYRLLKTDSRTRTLANSRLRISDGTQARASFGQEIPVVQSIIQPFAQGGEPVQQQSVQYQTIGVNISMTPRTHPNDEVSLSLDIELSTLGDSLNDLPTFGTRQVVTAIRLRDGETNILGGLIRDDERTARESVPGLGDIPVLGRMFGRNRREAEQTDVVVMLTPHILRSMSITADDLRPFLLPRDAIGAGMLDIGPTVPPPPVVRPPGGGGGSGGGPIEPEFMLPSFPVTAASPSGTIVPLARPAAEPLPAGGGRR